MNNFVYQSYFTEFIGISLIASVSFPSLWSKFLWFSEISVVTTFKWPCLCQKLLYCNIEYIGGKLATHYHMKPKSHFLKFDPNDWFCAGGSQLCLCPNSEPVLFSVQGRRVFWRNFRNCIFCSENISIFEQVNHQKVLLWSAFQWMVMLIDFDKVEHFWW
jgi:hypothetical protein